MILYVGGGTLFKVGATSARQKNYRKCLWFELATVTSQALNMTSFPVHHMKV